MTSINGNLILTPYNKIRELRSTEVASGFVMTANKIGLECLELLVDAVIVLGHNKTLLPKGAKIYFKEETLYTQKWPKQVFESDKFPGGFVVGNISDVLFFGNGEV